MTLDQRTEKEFKTFLRETSTIIVTLGLQQPDEKKLLVDVLMLAFTRGMMLGSELAIERAIQTIRNHK